MFKIKFDLEQKKKLINPEDLLPKTVENTRGELMPFDAFKIIDSLVKETNLDRNKAVEVTRRVLRKISSLGLDFIAAPHLRELVCGELTAMGLHEYRNHYTRLGIPIFDVKTMLEGKVGNKLNVGGINSTLSYVWIANQVIEQYVHLDQLSPKARELHLTGRIHIDMMEFWDEPISQLWDLRTILMYGLPPIPLAGVAKSRPAQNALTAVSHAAKWLGLAQKEFSGSLGYDNFTTFIAPYLKGLKYKEREPNVLDILQVAQSFVYEANQICGSFWGQNVNVFVTCTPNIPDYLKNIPAVSHGGQVQGVYGDYEEEVRNFFRALVEVYGEGDAAKNSITIPKMITKINARGIEQNAADYQFLLEREILPRGGTYLVNTALPPLKNALYSEDLRIPLNKTEGLGHFPHNANQNFDFTCSLNNFGVIQSVTVNLPRAAYEAKKNNIDIFAQLDQWLPEIKAVLLKKYDMIVKEIKAEPSKLPFCRECLEEKHLGVQCLYNLANQFLVLSFLGMNECVQAMINHPITDSEGSALATKIIDHLQAFCRTNSEETKLNFILSGNASDESAERFAKLDLKYLPELAKNYIKGLDTGEYYYEMGLGDITAQDSAALKVQIATIGALQQKLGHGTMIDLPKKFMPQSPMALWDFIKDVLEKDGLLGFRLV
jgi:ribonucleoside-triphosphate reductase